METMDQARSLPELFNEWQSLGKQMNAKDCPEADIDRLFERYHRIEDRALDAQCVTADDVYRKVILAMDGPMDPDMVEARLWREAHRALGLPLPPDHEALAPL